MSMEKLSWNSHTPSSNCLALAHVIFTEHKLKYIYYKETTNLELQARSSKTNEISASYVHYFFLQSKGLRQTEILSILKSQ
jgi:hypothetical protein